MDLTETGLPSLTNDRQRNGKARVIPVSVVDRAIVDGPELSSRGNFSFRSIFRCWREKLG